MFYIYLTSFATSAVIVDNFIKCHSEINYDNNKNRLSSLDVFTKYTFTLVKSLGKCIPIMLSGAIIQTLVDKKRTVNDLI